MSISTNWCWNKHRHRLPRQRQHLPTRAARLTTITLRLASATTPTIATAPPLPEKPAPPIIVCLRATATPQPPTEKPASPVTVRLRATAAPCNRQRAAIAKAGNDDNCRSPDDLAGTVMKLPPRNRRQ